MRRVLFLLFGLLFLIGSGFVVWSERTKPLSSTMVIHNQPLYLELATTATQRQQGLSDRPFLPTDHGLLFVFPKAGLYPFWMARMQFPIDIIWIHERRIVEIHENVPFPRPGETPMTIEPHGIADRVLEINAGAVRQYQLQIGDILPTLP